ncbi:diguanylate cyclase [Pseudothauera nasutitermitis]|nr:diguanylate cyclase [Pseudothauera nasutitermitis]
MLFLSCMLWACTPVRAGGAPWLDAAATRINAASWVSVLADPGGDLDLRQAVEAFAAGRFSAPSIATRRAALNFGYRDEAVWLYLEPRRAPDAPARWLLEIGFASLDQVEVFQADATGDWKGARSGDLLPFSARPLAHINHVFPLDFGAGDQLRVFVRVRSHGSLTLPVTLWSPAALHAEDQRRYAGEAVYFGMLSALALYNLLLWATLRERVFLYYVGFAAGMAVGFAGQNGLGAQFLWPAWPAWANISFPVGMASAGLFGALFTRAFLASSRSVPGLDGLLRLSVFVFLFAILAHWLIGYRAAAMLTSLAGLCFAPLAVVCGVRAWWAGHPGARYFLVAWILLLLGVAVMAMRNFGWVPTNWVTIYAMQIGSALEMLLLSFALADRINEMRREREEARQAALEAARVTEQALERRVAERTGELEAANARLRENEQALQQLAFHDALTGLPNRMVLDDRLRQAIARAARQRVRFAVLVVDLDGFKEVNDRGGHAVGDRVLRIAAERMRGLMRASDTLARIGGDEFVAVVEPVGDEADAVAVAAKLVDALDGPVNVDGDGYRIGGSIGVALFPMDGDSVETLVRAADRAMYRAKAAGRGAWRRAAVDGGQVPAH